MDTTIKILAQDDNTATIGGYGVIFGGHDLEGETFTANTKFMLDLVPDKLILYDHAQNDVKNVIGVAPREDIIEDENGLWIQAQLDKSQAYVTSILQLAEKGVLGFSSGTIGHLARRDGKMITHWPIVEFSLTPTPAEPRTILHTQRIKQLINDNPEIKALLPEDFFKSSDNVVDGDSVNIEIISSNEDNKMSDERLEAVEKSVSDIDKTLSTLSEGFSSLMSTLENMPNTAKKVSLVAQDSEGKDHLNTKSFADFIMAVGRGNDRRLKAVYNSTKDNTEDTAVEGGYLVPDEFHAQLLQVQAVNNQIMGRVTHMPVNSVAGSIPSLDNYTAVTANAGDSPYAGGVTAEYTGEGAALTETQAVFKEIRYRLNKSGGYSEVTNELLADSPLAVQAILTNLFGTAIAQRNEFMVLRGSGVGQPEGLLNAASTIAVTTATNNVWAVADALAMLDRFKSVGGTPVWIMAPGMLNETILFETSGGGSVVQTSLAAGVSNMLFGYDMIISEHMPVPDTDDVMLVDLSSYLWFEKGGLTIDASAHAAFVNDKITYRFQSRNDGRSWLNSAITPSNGGSTLSPCLYHND